MNAKSTIQVLLVLCAVPVESAVSAVCQQESLDGTRVLKTNCGGTCGKYEVGSGLGDLGFGTGLGDAIWFEFYTLATGPFNLGSGNNTNYATCDQCILVFQDFVASNPQKTFFQTGGTITIDPGTVPGSTGINLSWSNVTLAEVTIDQITFESTLVPDGACYTITTDTIFRSGFEAP